ncbi:MAG: polyphosphate polymerase domain-containing protein [Lachnospiraceae bacterium]|nr:polyphosphate polymerase domain-containing protein [Lachnospiraceae bacterium]
MNFGKNVYRHELKYLINYGEMEVLRRRLEAVASVDSHAVNGQYMIRSLYFDDMWGNSYEEKMMGTASRKKYRIRIYNYSDTVINLERKHKEGNYIYKTVARLTREEADAVINGDLDRIAGHPDRLVKEFYAGSRFSGMKPEVIVDYDRIPMVYEPGTVRITFDMHLRGGFAGYDIFDPAIPVYSAMEGDALIMEVKYTEFLPDIIRHIIAPAGSVYMAASKYTLCCDVKRRTYDMEVI